MMMRFGLLLLLAAGCTELGSTPRFEGPEPHTLEISVSTEPPPAADGVVRDAVIRATFDDYLNPDTVFFGPVVLKSGRGNFDADLRLDFVGRAILIQPRALLLPQTTYELVIGPTVSSLAGHTVGAQRTFRIDVGATVAGPQPPKPRVTWEKDLTVVIGQCAPYCHTTRGCSSPLREPTRQINVALPNDPVYGFVNVPALGQRGLLRPLLRVAPFDASRSQLMRKLVGGNVVRDTSDPPYPDVGVDGRRMPLPERVCNEDPRYLTDEQIRLVQEWIDGGAPLN
jgi:hypothetical protein